MDNQKRLVLAIALSVLVIFMYQSYMRKFYRPGRPPTVVPQPPVVSRETSERKTQRITRPGREAQRRFGEDRRQAGYEQGLPEEEVSREPKPAIQEQTVAVENELYRAVLTDQGAGIKEFYLLQFKDKEGNPAPLSQVREDQPLVLETEETAGAGRGNIWQLLRHTDDVVVYKKEENQKAVIKTFKFHNTNYIIELELNILSKASFPQEVRYKIVGGSGIVSKGHIDNRYVGADIQIADKIHRRRPSHKSIQEGEIFYGSPDWVSAKSRYFSFILKPEQPEKAAFIESTDRKSISSGVILGPLNLGPKDEIKHRFILYAGPNSTENLAALGPTAKNTISYGVLSGIADIILGALKLFYRIFGNYGVAIIMIAVLISIILLPLTKKSFRSMKEMQKIQPEVEKIRKAYSNNPQKMNKEVMELYKKHKINPLGGCFPMFLQLPIFIALYQTLIRSVELKGASFLWIMDLSEPDAAFKLPQTFPIIGNYINILPILMALAMVVQQKVTQPKGLQSSEQQRIMSTIFPVFLGVIFYNLPSGLVLYWLTNTILMLIMQQGVVLRPRLR